MTTAIEQLASCSRRYGRDSQFVFMGGGNTSCKDENILYVKPSGVSLSTIQAEDFVLLDRAALRRVFEEKMPADQQQRENKVKQLMTAALHPSSHGRASVEAPLHELLPYRYVVHTHPVLVNGMTCGQEGKRICEKLFPESLWVNYSDPGYSLAMAVKEKIEQATENGKPVPQLIFLQNHGLFAAADTVDEIDALYNDTVDHLHKFYLSAGIDPDLPTEPADQDSALRLAPALRGACRAENAGIVLLTDDRYKTAAGPLSPDHLIYAGSFPFTGDVSRQAIQEWRRQHGYTPRVFSFPDTAVFTIGGNLQQARNIRLAARNAAQICHLAQACGGVRYLNEREYRFIESWEAESYRIRITGKETEKAAGRMVDRVCLVTGAAQGFGLEIARGLAREGAIVGLADINLEGVRKAADNLAREIGSERIFCIAVDIGDETSVAEMIAEITRRCGGLDLLVANAGVLKAGSAKEMSLSDWELVTKINYTGYFLCVKHASLIMAAQNRAGEGQFWSDIVQVNSKSGLEGSSRNAAYAGSKFGGIGLTQSFAKELVEDGIKVNSVCPGNYFEGPLWSDPEKGLFVQYLRTGKVTGAKSIEEVKAFYESKVPMGRGCRPEDVVKAIIYLVEQDYETGQALPVSGGQVMLP